MGNIMNRESDAYKSFERLWKTDDQQWVEQRKKNWRLAFEKYGGDPHTLAQGKFYVFGEEPSDLTDDDISIRFKFTHRIAFTPFQTAGQVKDFWQATLGYYIAGSQQRHMEVRYIGELLDRFPERDTMVRLVSETLYAPEFFMCPADPRSGRAGNLSTIDPGDFVVTYAGLASFYHRSNLHKWDYRNFSHEYFMLSVRYCEDNNILASRGYFDDLADMYEFLLRLEDSELSEYRLELKQKLVDSAEGDDAPRLLRKALEDARSRMER